MIGSLPLDTFPDREEFYCKHFEVPVRWLVEKLLSDKSPVGDNITLIEFLDDYTWEETWWVYNEAEAAGVIISEEDVT